MSVENPNSQNNNGVVTESCGCVFSWNDKFYEKQCAEHEFAAPQYLESPEHYAFWADRFADETGEDFV